MTSQPLIKPTTADDLASMQKILETTQLFPAEILPEMMAPFLQGETKALWLTCYEEEQISGFCYAAPEELTDRTWNLLAIAVPKAWVQLYSRLLSTLLQNKTSAS